MITREEYTKRILGPLHRQKAVYRDSVAFMPTNIALIKYWGKRNAELNLPLVNSLSYTLDGYGTQTKLSIDTADSLIMNGVPIDPKDEVSTKAFGFVDLFRAEGEFFRIETTNNIPTAAGVASSASGFAALLSAIARIKGWDIPLREQSMLARLGSGSAARSFWPGLVLWNKGERDDGMDCYAEPWPTRLPICMSVLVLSTAKKPWSSRDAMRVSLSTSELATEWPALQQSHLEFILAPDNSFTSFGAAAESNAILLHRLLAQSSPSIVYDLPITQIWKKKIQGWRENEELRVYFTQDAGPNLKLLFPLEIKGKIEEKLAREDIDYFTV